MPAPTPVQEPPDPRPDAELEHERSHLAGSRAALARMRERTAALDAAAAGDWVSRQFLESAILRRMKALADDPTVPLFFGRLDYDADHPDARGERFYIGRRHVSDEVGDPMVVDWRAPISLPFYRAGRAEPMGVLLRRRFGFQHGELTAFEDEALTADLLAMREQALPAMGEAGADLTFAAEELSGNADLTYRLLLGTYDSPNFMSEGESDNSIIVRDVPAATGPKSIRPAASGSRRFGARRSG